MRVEFRCDKDPKIAEYHQEVLAPLFNADLARHGVLRLEDEQTRTELFAKWDTQMRAEAAFQEHYDYDLVGGKRVVRTNGGKPRLLVPEVEVVDRPRLLIPEVEVVES